MESYSQSWSPKEEFRTQVRARHSRNGHEWMFSSAIWGSPLPGCLLRPIFSFLPAWEFEEHGQVFSQGKAEVGAPMVYRQATIMNCVPGLMQLAAGECSSPPQPMGSLLSLSGGVCVAGSQDRNVTSRTVQMDCRPFTRKEKEKSPHCFLVTP